MSFQIFLCLSQRKHRRNRRSDFWMICAYQFRPLPICLSRSNCSWESFRAFLGKRRVFAKVLQSTTSRFFERHRSWPAVEAANFPACSCLSLGLRMRLRFYRAANQKFDNYHFFQTRFRNLTPPAHQTRFELLSRSMLQWDTTWANCCWTLFYQKTYRPCCRYCFDR